MTIMPHSFILAEDEGFKPPIPVMGIPDFESSAFGHSANLPFYLVRCKSNTFFASDKILLLFFNYINPAL